MEVLKDVALGALTWFLSISAFVSTLLACEHLWGPPITDRARSFAHIVGGGMTLLLSAIAVGIIVTIIASHRPA